ncbi:Dor1-domain-containing protein [Massarina eburnea CBS 473.64]|uniref:Conserved oligomeric Golgi complex subunit 8 n=1 Tax=Massarina eburnea CBS 473.64 TaxID=1395130 RepID=A0A6A6RGQ5_9PLEO|nr:Dor1-domain-containing protein [Massarina eburnea CBS 473.64]
MADPLYELLIPYFDAQHAARPVANDDAVTTAYLARLTTLPLAALSASEPQLLAQNSQSILRALQVLSKRSHKQIISSTDHLAHLRTVLPKIGQNAATIHTELPRLESAAQSFAEKYGKSSENAILDRRRKAMLLSRNIDRVTDVLDLPNLLSSAISSSTAGSTATSTPSSTTATNANYASALDLYAHIKRLTTLYPSSPLVTTLSAQAEQEMKTMTTNLITSLQSSSIKLAGAMRTIGWLRRVAPELDEAWSSRQIGPGIGSGEGSLGALFLVCRLACLESMLAALDPLRELADQESERRVHKKSNTPGKAWASGQQTEKYLKKYLDIFREQSFAIISMYKSIFPSALPAPDTTPEQQKPQTTNPLQPIPSALATFPLHLLETLFETLHTYLPNISDRSSRDSLLTQVLYCAGSLGRLGADFSLMIAVLEEELRDAVGDNDEDDNDADEIEIGSTETEEEWVEVMKKHRVQASRLELLASGVGAGRSSFSGGMSPVDRMSSPVH